MINKQRGTGPPLLPLWQLPATLRRHVTSHFSCWRVWKFVTLYTSCHSEWETVLTVICLDLTLRYTSKRMSLLRNGQWASGKTEMTLGAGLIVFEHHGTCGNQNYIWELSFRLKLSMDIIYNMFFTLPTEDLSSYSSSPLLPPPPHNYFPSLRPLQLRIANYSGPTTAACGAAGKVRVIGGVA
ncbi:hypothetical protein J6590_041097 [Homalodisca vitripennis]|nr:hypothetical protein J6590_041097 [Homalodisca vitripennis]